MSLLKARAPGVLPKVVATVVRMACIASARAWSTISHAWVILWGGLLYINACGMLATIWCIHSQIKFDCGFLLVDCMSLILNIWSNHWNASPMNSPPFSWTHCVGHGYHASHDCMNLLHMCNDLLLTRTNSTRLDAVSMHVNALNLTLRSLTFTVQGPIKSIATSSQDVMCTLHLGSSPKPRPESLCFWQWLHLNLSIVYCNFGW
mgnify:CR=1 FL=1